MSLLAPLGMGTVTATKDTDTNEILVYVPGLFPQAEGRNVADTAQVERSSKNAFGEDVRSVSLKSNSIPAVWKKMDNSNRITAPDVREGSQVAIYKAPGQNQYYWTLDGVNPETFRLETVMYGWSANPNLDENTEFDVANFYTFVMDTRAGLAQLRTSQANGEQAAFDIQINGMDGTLTIGSNNSMVTINDVEQFMVYQNALGAILNINKKSASLYLPEALQLFADELIAIRTKQLLIQAEKADIDIGLTRWKGKVERTGDTEQLGNYTQTGMYKHIGDVDRTGNSVSTGTVVGMTDVRTLTVSLNLHFHGGVRNGDGVTTPPIPT